MLRGIVVCSTWVAWLHSRSTLWQDLSPARANKASVSKDWAAMPYFLSLKSIPIDRVHSGDP